MRGGLVEPRGRAVGGEASLVEFDPGFGDPALRGVVFDNLASERGAFRRPHHHQLDQEFAEPDRPHAMMNSRRPEADLRDFKAFAFFAKQVRSGYPDIVEGELADRGYVILTAHPAEPPDQADAGRIHRHDDAGMPAGWLGTRIGHAQPDHEAASRMRGTGDEAFTPVDDVIVTIADDCGRDIARIR